MAAQEVRLEIPKREFDTIPKNDIAINHYEAALFDNRDFTQGIQLLSTASDLAPTDEIVTAKLAYACEIGRQGALTTSATCPKAPARRRGG